MTRLLLNFIFKNEARNLPRLLRSLKPHIIGCVALDTGDPASTDDSDEIIRHELQGLTVIIGREPFQNFAQARNAALRLARTQQTIDYDYLLFADCDHELITTYPFPKLTLPAYGIMQVNAHVRYFNIRLLRRDETCEYVGKTHECIIPSTPPGVIDGLYYRDHETGTNRGDKFRRDVKLLSEELREDPTNPRFIFYMLQSLIGAEMNERAFEFCDLRLRVEGHPEERYWAQFHRAQLGLMLQHELADVLVDFIKAYEMRPQRAEPLVELASLHRRLGQPHIGLIYARDAALRPYPVTEILPVDQATYEWRALDEWLVNAVEANNIVEARQAARRLSKRALPDDMRERIITNCNAVLKKPMKERAPTSTSRVNTTESTKGYERS